MNRNNYPDLDTLFSTVNPGPRKIEDPLLNPVNQMQLMSRFTNEPMTHPYSIGPTLLTNPDKSQNLFFQNYSRSQDASRDFQTSMNNTRKSIEALPPLQQTQAKNIPKTCQVYPPLLVRYNDMKSKEDKYIPAKILAGGELRLTEDIPDIILNFHADTHAITITVCKINPQKVKDYELTIWTLYSMYNKNPDNMLDIPGFSLMYDQTRYELLKAILSHNQLNIKAKRG